MVAEVDKDDERPRGQQPKQRVIEQDVVKFGMPGLFMEPNAPIMPCIYNATHRRHHDEEVVPLSGKKKNHHERPTKISKLDERRS